MRFEVTWGQERRAAGLSWQPCREIGDSLHNPPSIQIIGYMHEGYYGGIALMRAVVDAANEEEAREVVRGEWPRARCRVGPMPDDYMPDGWVHILDSWMKERFGLTKGERNHV